MKFRLTNLKPTNWFQKNREALKIARNNVAALQATITTYEEETAQWQLDCAELQQKLRRTEDAIVAKDSLMRQVQHALNAHLGDARPRTEADEHRDVVMARQLRRDTQSVDKT